MLKEVALRKLRKKPSRTRNMFKTLGISALAGIGMYRLAKNRHLLRRLKNLNINTDTNISSKNLFNCISQCKNVLNELEALQNRSQDIVIKSTLEESHHHLNMCVRECEFALTQIT